MKAYGYMLFFLIVLLVLVLVNSYLYARTRVLVPEGSSFRWLFSLFFWLLAFSYLLGRLAERTGAAGIAEPLVRVGSWWLGAMVYLTLFFLFFDLLRGFLHLASVRGLPVFDWESGWGRRLSAAALAGTALVVVAGYFNARNPVVRVQPVVLGKAVPGGTFRAVLVSDIHLGITISNGRLSRLVELINRQKGDAVLMAGDIFDEDLGPVIRNNLGDLLRNLQAGQGVYAVLGNHEFYGNADAAVKYLRDHRITVLRDSLAVLPSGITIAGREDLAGRQILRKERMPLRELLAAADTSKPVILMDHQPYDLSAVAGHPVDLQVSGHTHHGQLWPFHLITGALFEISKGYGRIGNTHFYVSPGVGTWGPPIRTSGRPEIIVLEITGS